ncbi:MAG: hypothetical protein KJ042_07245 [Deltaproteobacteria bacterium]|nr:hypothetical protein [Deltaproteobacteria bacterium]
MDIGSAETLSDCRRRLDAAQGRLADVDSFLFARDYFGAAAAVREAWRGQLVSCEYLATCWDGEFWNSWPGREIVARNIAGALAEMHEAEVDRSPRMFRRMADLIGENLHQLRGGLALAHADIGAERA